MYGTYVQQNILFIKRHYGFYSNMIFIHGLQKLTYPYTLNGLLKQHYTSTKPIIIFFVDDENFLPPFSKEDKEDPLIFFKHHPLSCDKSLERRIFPEN